MCGGGSATRRCGGSETRGGHGCETRGGGPVMRGGSGPVTRGGGGPVLGGVERAGGAAYGGPGAYACDPAIEGPGVATRTARPRTGTR